MYKSKLFYILLQSILTLLDKFCAKGANGRTNVSMSKQKAVTNGIIGYNNVKNILHPNIENETENSKHKMEFPRKQQ